MKVHEYLIQRKHYFLRRGISSGIVRIKDFPYSVPEEFRERILPDTHGFKLFIHLKPLSNEMAWYLISREISKIIPEVITSGNIISRELEKRKLEKDNLTVLKENITAGNASLYTMNSLILFNDTPKRVAETKDLIKNELRKNNVKTESKIYEDIKYLRRLESDKSFYIESSSLSSIIPVNRGYLLDENGVYLGLDAKTNAPIFLNRRGLQSSHQLVFGMTGFGKSYLVKATLYREKIVNNPEIIIIDPMGEYDKIAKNLVIKEVDLANAGIDIFKPLDFMSPKENTERTVSLLSLIFNLSEIDRGLLDAEITKFYEKNSNINELKDEIRIRNRETFNKISPIFEGSLKMLSSDNEIDLTGSGRINLGGVPKSLLPFYMLLSLELVMRQKSHNNRIVVIDEAHYLLDERSVITLERYVRHARHDNISLIMISQSANDFFKSKYTVSILENCSIHILLKHQNVTDEMSNFYHFDENLKYFLKYSAGFDGTQTWAYLQIPGFKAIVKFNSSPDEHEKIEGVP